MAPWNALKNQKKTAGKQNPLLSNLLQFESDDAVYATIGVIDFITLITAFTLCIHAVSVNGP